MVLITYKVLVECHIYKLMEKDTKSQLRDGSISGKKEEEEEYVPGARKYIVKQISR